MTTTSKALAPIDGFRRTVTAMEPEIKKVLPAHIPTEKFIRTVMTTVQLNPVLLECTQQSVLSAVMQSAQSGLLADGREAAIVKYGDKAQFLPMVAGILKKVRNSGELLSITSQNIYANDKFKYWIDSDGEHLEHEPFLFGERGEAIGVYALAKTKDGGVYIEVLTESQIAAVKNVSRSKGGPWSGPFEDEMRKKTAIRRLSKRLPMNTDLQGVIQSDDDLYELPGGDGPMPIKEVKTTSSRLTKAIQQIPTVEAVTVEKKSDEEECPI